MRTLRPRSVLSLIAFVALMSAPCHFADAREPKPPKVSWVAAGAGVGLAQTVHLDLSVWPGVDWLSIDAMAGAFLAFATVTARGGLTLHWQPSESVAAVEGPNSAWLLHFDAGVDHGFVRGCLALDTTHCGPPELEGALNASAGYGWVSEAWVVRLLAGADYRWGKLPEPLETRYVFKGPFAPSVSIWFGARL